LAGDALLLKENAVEQAEKIKAEVEAKKEAKEEERKKLQEERKKLHASKYKGVHWNKRDNKWVAKIQYNGKQHRLGCFDDEERGGSGEGARPSRRRGQAVLGDVQGLPGRLDRKETVAL
jgi:hypothetical protein